MLNGQDQTGVIIADAYISNPFDEAVEVGSLFPSGLQLYRIGGTVRTVEEWTTPDKRCLWPGVSVDGPAGIFTRNPNSRLANSPNVGNGPQWERAGTGLGGTVTVLDAGSDIDNGKIQSQNPRATRPVSRTSEAEKNLALLNPNAEQFYTIDAAGNPLSLIGTGVGGGHQVDAHSTILVVLLATLESFFNVRVFNPGPLANVRANIERVAPLFFSRGITADLKIPKTEDRILFSAIENRVQISSQVWGKGDQATCSANADCAHGRAWAELVVGKVQMSTPSTTKMITRMAARGADGQATTVSSDWTLGRAPLEQPLRTINLPTR